MKPTTNTNLLDPSIRIELQTLLVGRICVVGVGNRYRSDDAAGPRVIDLCRSEKSGVWIDAGVAPENFLERIARTNPDVVLIVDAVDFGGTPGECQIMDINIMEMVVISTHSLSLRMLGDYLAIRTDARVSVLAIQPEVIDMGEGLSDPVARSVHAMSVLLSDLLSNSEPASS